MQEQLIELFYEYLPAWTWEEWQAAGASDKEEIAINAIADLGPEVDIEEAYDLFYDWVAGLTEADFRSDLEEGNKITNRFADGGMSLARDIDMRISAAEIERRRQAEQERKARAAALAAEQRAAALERKRQLAIESAEDAIAKGVIDEYNEANRISILSNFGNNVYPAIDPETKELVFDKEDKRRILEPITQRVEAEKEAKKAAEKEAARKAAERRAAEKPITYYLYPEVVINGETMRSPDGTRVVGQDNRIRVAKEVAREELKWINTERKFYVAEGHPFNWDGVITIISENPDDTEETFRTFRVRTNEGLGEAVKVVSDPDVLYHYTNPLPFCLILKSDSLRKDINEGAVCFTTDANYRIYGCPIGLQFSRQRLVDAGYDLEDYDDALAYDPDWEEEYSESEERIYETVTGIKKLLTAVHVHWSPEGMTQDQAPDSIDYPFIDVAQSTRGDIIGDDNPTATSLADSLVWKIPMSYFRRRLRELQAAGIKIYEYGAPMKDIYWLDENNELHDGPMPEAGKEEEPATIASATEEPVPAVV